MPGNMDYIAHGEGGETSCLIIAQREIPQPAAGEVLIEVAYAGVNRPDVMQRQGSYAPPPGASPYLGLEVSGRIAALGDGVSGWQIGDEVCALTPGGGYAQYCLTQAAHCLPVPRGLTLLQAAALPENYFTVWTNIFERGHLKEGESFMVHGGSSGIGLTAIQLAKAFGATVMTTVGNKEKAQACLKAGADEAILYRDADFVDVVAEKTHGKGIDMILDMVGGSYIERNVKALALEGRLVQIAFLEGSKITFDAMPIMLKRLSFTGSTLRARTNADKATIAKALQTSVWPLLEAGKTLPVIHSVIPMTQASDAHALMESSTHIGKIMLEIEGG